MKKMLIAEDDPTSSMLLQEMLKRFGPIELADNGETAVEMVRAAMDAGVPFDLVCLDIMMPGMDGYEVLKRIRGLETSRGIPPAAATKVFMITALDDLTNVIEAFRGLCDAYLLKPIENASLMQRMREYVLTG